MASLGRYDLGERLGKGGFATVYCARDPLLERDVALKVPSADMSEEPDPRRRFVAEAQTLARLQHPNIVTVYDVGEADGRPFFAMELVAGRTLAETLAGGVTFQWADVLRVLTPLADAVSQRPSRPGRAPVNDATLVAPAGPSRRHPASSLPRAVWIGGVAVMTLLGTVFAVRRRGDSQERGVISVSPTASVSAATAQASITTAPRTATATPTPQPATTTATATQPAATTARSTSGCIRCGVHTSPANGVTLDIRSNSYESWEFSAGGSTVILKLRRNTPPYTPELQTRGATRALDDPLTVRCQVIPNARIIADARLGP